MADTKTGRTPGDSLVIFDCDGVLVDSEVLAIRVLVDAIRRAGGTIEETDAYQLFLGRSLATVAIGTAQFVAPTRDAMKMPRPCWSVAPVSLTAPLCHPSP